MYTSKTNSRLPNTINPYNMERVHSNSIYFFAMYIDAQAVTQFQDRSVFHRLFNIFVSTFMSVTHVLMRVA